MKRKVSVAVCTYRGEAYIAQQLQSILGQTRPVDEIIVCDDRSPDATVQIAKCVLQEAELPCRVQVNPQNLGVTGNFEKCVSACTGDIILTADQDDVWAPEKVARLLPLFDDPDVVLAYSDANVIDGAGSVLLPSLYRRDGFRPEPFTQNAFEDAVVRLSQTVYGCTMAFRKSFLQRILPFYRSKANHDAWIMCCAPLYGAVRFLPEPLISYRIHGANTVASLGGSAAWDEISAAQDAFDRYFAVQPLRALRLELLSVALSRSERRGGRYPGRIRSANRFYRRLLQMKRCGALSAGWMLALSYLDGSYHYRFCDRGRTVTAVLRLKQFFRDLRYLISRKETL